MSAWVYRAQEVGGAPGVKEWVVSRVGESGDTYSLAGIVARAELPNAVLPLLDHTRYWRRIWVDGRIPCVDSNGLVTVRSGDEARFAVWLFDAEGGVAGLLTRLPTESIARSQ